MTYEEMKSGKSNRLNIGAKTSVDSKLKPSVPTRSSAYASSFSPTNTVAGYLAIDSNNKKWRAGTLAVHDFSEIIDFELLEDDSSVVKSGGLGRAVAGGLLFGGVGAVVGAVTRGKKSDEFCNSMKIKITLHNTALPVIYINFIDYKIKKNDYRYAGLAKSAQECLSLLQIIVNDNANTQTAQQQASSAPVQQTSAADEIRKFKALLDDGIITQAEFDAKKTELLGL